MIESSALASSTAARNEQSPSPTVTSHTPSPGSASAPSNWRFTVTELNGVSGSQAANPPIPSAATVASAIPACVRRPTEHVGPPPG